MARTKKGKPPQASLDTRGVRHSTPARLVSWFLLALGLIALAFSIIYSSSILAFIGLGLTFWGALALYISPGKYVKQTLLDSTVVSSLADLNQILTELKYLGKGIYLPPKYLKDFETTKVYIPKNKNTNLPTPKEIQREEHKIFLKNPEAALIIPPGLSLSKLFEKTLGTTFTIVDLEYLQQNLPKLFVEDLEIAEDLKIEISKVAKKNHSIHVKMANSVYNDICKETRKFSNICGSIGCSICSAIACALTKATGKPVIIETIQPSTDGETIETTYQLLETTETQKQAARVRAEQAEKAPVQIREAVHLHPRRLPNLAGLSLTVFGSIVLLWVGWLTWYDTTTWGKDFADIFFGSRTGEAISLGIGMKVIYYFLIGLVLLLPGLVTLLRRRSKCPHYFGYLASRPKNVAIPEECLICPTAADCMVTLVRRSSRTKEKEASLG